MQRITDADLTLDFRVGQSGHNRATLHIGLTRSHIPGRHSHPQLQPRHNSRTIPRVERNARLHRLLQKLLLLSRLLVRLGLYGQLILLVVRAGQGAQLRTVLLQRPELVDLLPLREYPVQRRLQTLLLAQTEVAHCEVTASRRAIAQHMIQRVGRAVLATQWTLPLQSVAEAVPIHVDRIHGIKVRVLGARIGVRFIIVITIVLTVNVQVLGRKTRRHRAIQLVRFHANRGQRWVIAIKTNKLNYQIHYQLFLC